MANGGIVRVGSFNVENLFSRARVFTEDDQSTGSAVLSKIVELQRLLEEPVYQKSKIVKLFNDVGLDRYITIRCDRVVKADAATRFFNAIDHGKANSVNSAIDGPNDWVGAIEFKRDDLDEPSKATLGRVIRDDLKADILCLCEVEDRRTLQEFNDGMLGGLYPYNVLIEGNDPRGIDATRLNQAVTQCGAVYTGRFTDGTNGVPTPLAAASDHAAIWVDIKIPGLLHA